MLFLILGCLIVLILIALARGRAQRIAHEKPGESLRAGLFFGGIVAFFIVIANLSQCTAHAQSPPNNVYDSNVRPPARSSQHHSRYIYFAATHFFTVEDSNGELHSFASYLCRFDPATHTTQWQLENGRWVTP